jgi:hypothetical protein
MARARSSSASHLSRRLTLRCSGPADHKVLGRGRPSVIFLCGRWRARVLQRPWPAAELSS